MAEDRLKEILEKEFSALTEDEWKELKDLISAITEAEEMAEEKPKEETK